VLVGSLFPSRISATLRIQALHLVQQAIAESDPFVSKLKDQVCQLAHAQYVQGHFLPVAQLHIPQVPKSARLTKQRRISLSKAVHAGIGAAILKE
jgi:hypothetical protein